MFGFIEELQAASLLGSRSTADGIDFAGPREGLSYSVLNLREQRLPIERSYAASLSA